VNNNLDIFEETMSEEEIEFYKRRPIVLIRNLEVIEAATKRNLKILMSKIDCDTTPQEHKFVQEAVNKAGEALGVLGKAALISTPLPADNVRTIRDIKTISDFYEN